MIEFREISARNYRSYQEFVLPIREGKHLIVGPNGEGKSLLFQSMMECLYQCTLRDDDPSHYGDGDCEVAVTFAKDGDEFQIKRFWNPPIAKDFNPQILKNCEDISSRKKAEGRRDLDRILNLSYNLFINTVVVSQGLPKSFCSLGPSVRSTVIEEILCAMAWDEMRLKISKSKATDSVDREDILEELNSKKGKMIAINSQVELLKKLKQEDKDDLTLRVRQVKESMRETKKVVDGLALQVSDIHDVKEQKDSLDATISALCNRAGQLESLLETKKCPTCDREYPVDQIEGCRREYSFLVEKIDKIKSKIRTLLDQYAEKASARDKMTQFSAVLSMQDEEVKHLCERRDQVIRDDIVTLESNLSSVLSDVNDIKDRYDQVSTSITNQEWIDSQLLPSSKFRTKLVSNYLVGLNSIIESISPIFGEYLVKLVDVRGGVGIELDRKGKKTSYSSFSGGERRRIDIIIILSLMRFIMTSSGVCTNLLVFDEIFEHLDAHGIGCALDSIDALFPESQSIYVISHNDALKSRFSSIVKVSKQGGVSRLEV